MSFTSEALLFNEFYNSPFIKNFVESSIFPTIGVSELRGLFGIPDLVIANFAIDKETPYIYRSFAFEMKLQNWKKAIVQAFKYQAFADFSFVVLDSSYIHLALNNIDRFQKSNVGLISIDTSSFINIHFLPIESKPYTERLKNKLDQILLSYINEPEYTNFLLNPSIAYDLTNFSYY